MPASWSVLALFRGEGVVAEAAGILVNEREPWRPGRLSLADRLDAMADDIRVRQDGYRLRCGLSSELIIPRPPDAI